MMVWKLSEKEAKQGEGEDGKLESKNEWEHIERKGKSVLKR